MFIAARRENSLVLKLHSFAAMAMAFFSERLTLNEIYFVRTFITENILALNFKWDFFFFASLGAKQEMPKVQRWHLLK